ncbi:GSCFA domain-containing protein [Reichenbachiella sp. MSK19-1]|uniref:GSCFA domain-containing protein n=1 Tax=Reichenbachiella sp. MSK19-1 TaxID=1897631 RepID=UPI000E6CE290|nr:GSCFA domain-containing protein [Reichenbachiella sp. MSK19-1]RJE75060.1 hypothetical protein BGP76_18275 [Reichenbachiella sp. MSK19-1]
MQLPLKTDIKIKSFNESIQLGQQIVTLGSCFAQGMGERLQQFKFDTLVNPFGVVFNPVSLANLLRDSPLDTSRFVERDGLCCHYDYHFDVRAESPELLVEQIAAKRQQVQFYLQSADWLILTFGSATVYEYNGQVVANCHKQPQHLFDKRMLRPDEMNRDMQDVLGTLQKHNPKLKVILTVSPVRHIKDGITENQLSKSLLRVLCDQLSQNNGVYYFPSYEVMVDDLRDYRFYKSDMVHPTEQAEEYIWNSFLHAAMDEHSKDFIKQWYLIRTAMAHRPFNPKTAAHRQFLLQSQAKLSAWRDVVDVQEEYAWFEQQLTAL